MVVRLPDGRCGYRSTASANFTGAVLAPVRLAGLVTDHLDIVAVGVEDERPVVVRMIMGPQPGAAVRAAARGQRGVIEGIDESAAVHSERDVQRRLVRTAAVDPEVRLRRLAETGHVRMARHRSR